MKHDPNLIAWPIEDCDCEYCAPGWHVALPRAGVLAVACALWAVIAWVALSHLHQAGF